MILVWVKEVDFHFFEVVQTTDKKKVAVKTMSY